MSKNWMMGTIVVVMVITGFSTACKKEEKVVLDSQTKKISYVLAYDYVRNLKKQQVTFDAASMRLGLADALADKTAKLSDEEFKKTMDQFTQEMRNRVFAERQQQAQKNLQVGEAFLAENAKKPGVQSTASGLQYVVLNAGTGPRPKETDTVKVHYRGMFTDGKEFDSSYSRGEPATFPLNGVIRGWIEALQLMTVGSKWKIFLPPALGYGERGAGEVIPPNSVLVFEVELLSIEKSPKKGS